MYDDRNDDAVRPDGRDGGDRGELPPGGAGAGRPRPRVSVDEIVRRLTEPSPDVLRPPEPDPGALERATRAHVFQRLAEVGRTFRPRVRKAEKALGKWQSRVRWLEALLVLRYGELAEAESEHREARRAPVPPRGPHHDHRRRALGRVGLAVVLALCVFADYLVDRSAFQALLLPLRLTQILAFVVAVVQMAAAHTVGRLLRRLKEAADPDAHRHERLAMRGLIAFVAVTVVGLAVLRGLLGGLMLGLILLGVGAAAAVVAAMAAYFHGSTRLDALSGTRRGVRRAGRWAAWRLRRLERARARREVAVGDLSSAAGEVVDTVDAIYAETGVDLNGDEPPWVGRYRRWAQQLDLPGRPQPVERGTS